MNGKLNVIALSVVCLLVIGCSSISKKDCVRGDWQTIGYKDGSRGYKPDRIQSHAKTCAKVDVVPDSVAYGVGHNAGVREYCTPENGARIGRNNDDYRGVCPTDLEYGFLENYVTALKIKRDDLEIERDSVKDDLDRARDKRARIPADEEVPRRLRKEIEYFESRLSSLNSDRLRINDRIAKWSQKL